MNYGNSQIQFRENGQVNIKTTLSKLELIKKMQEQLDKPEKFNKIFDGGDVSIAAEIAVKLRILFHNTNTSKSLYRQLRLRNVYFVDTASRFNSRNILTHLGLVDD
jgi:hypothetical protein